MSTKEVRIRDLALYIPNDLINMSNLKKLILSNLEEYPNLNNIENIPNEVLKNNLIKIDIDEDLLDNESIEILSKINE